MSTQTQLTIPSFVLSPSYHILNKFQIYQSLHGPTEFGL